MNILNLWDLKGSVHSLFLCVFSSSTVWERTPREEDLKRGEEGQTGAEPEGVVAPGTREGAAGQNLIIKWLATFPVGSINQTTTKWSEGDTKRLHRDKNGPPVRRKMIKRHKTTTKIRLMTTKKYKTTTKDTNWWQVNATKRPQRHKATQKGQQNDRK